MTNLKLSLGYAEHSDGLGVAHHRRGMICGSAFLGIAECRTYEFIYGWRYPMRIPGGAVHQALVTRSSSEFFFLHKEKQK